MNDVSANPNPDSPAPRPWWRKGLFLLRLMLRAAGVLALAGFVLFLSLGLFLYFRQRPNLAKPDRFVYILNHTELGKVTKIERVVHSEKRGLTQFVELEVAPFAEESLLPSKSDQTFGRGWTTYSVLDPAVASLVRQIQDRARAAKLDWFPDMQAIASDGMRLNLWSGALKHGEMDAGYLILCDYDHHRIFAAEIKP